MVRIRLSPGDAESKLASAPPSPPNHASFILLNAPSKPATRVGYCFLKVSRNNTIIPILSVKQTVALPLHSDPLEGLSDAHVFRALSLNGLISHCLPLSGRRNQGRRVVVRDQGNKTRRL